MSPLLGSGEGLLLLMSLWSREGLFDCKWAAKGFISLLLLLVVYCSVAVSYPCIRGSVKVVLIGRV